MCEGLMVGFLARTYYSRLSRCKMVAQEVFLIVVLGIILSALLEYSYLSLTVPLTATAAFNHLGLC